MKLNSVDLFNANWQRCTPPAIWIQRHQRPKSELGLSQVEIYLKPFSHFPPDWPANRYKQFVLLICLFQELERKYFMRFFGGNSPTVAPVPSRHWIRSISQILRSNLNCGGHWNWIISSLLAAHWRAFHSLLAFEVDLLWTLQRCTGEEGKRAGGGLIWQLTSTFKKSLWMSFSQVILPRGFWRENWFAFYANSQSAWPPLLNWKRKQNSKSVEF